MKTKKSTLSEQATQIALQLEELAGKLHNLYEAGATIWMAMPDEMHKTEKGKKLLAKAEDYRIAASKINDAIEDIKNIH